jgi:spore coat protein SA
MPRIRDAVPDALMVMTGRAQRIYEDQDELAMYDARIDQKIQENDLREHVHIGTYDHDDIPRLNALSDVVIYTTIGEEPFGLVPVEGMASGVPVVVTDSGGLTESVVDGETGFVISRDEEKLPGELAERVIELLEDGTLAEEMGRKGRDRVEEKFDKARMAKDLIEVSRDLLEGAG